MLNNKAILVIGGINMDFVVKAERVPKPGETLIGSDFSIIPGGKGANQAVCIARLRGKAILGGCLGKDQLGQQLKSGLKKEGVITDYISMDEKEHSGVTMIIINKDGDNSIVLDPGANMKFSPERASSLEKILPRVSIVLSQLEIPVETIDFIFNKAKKIGITTILDAGPAKPLPPSLLSNTDILSPNQTELESLLKRRITNVEQAKNEAEKLLEWGIKTVILKLGDKGSYLLTAKEKLYFPAFKVTPVDTTAAGDAFMGALCLSLTQNKPLPQAIEFANLAGACTVTKMGAQPSLPTLEEIEKVRSKIR
ncbi:ribokinase [Candidatus Aerophobetes bacterium]|uniref:Ribokinase n=1 Tax=Aerophobetes bacterium TaxID=2030807 RepID=A0A662DHB6_UNCAE|nr:MAG: ribokinase [Candidatus Aerophobetes bacterium]